MAVEERVVQEKQNVAGMIDILARNGDKALREFRCYSQEKVDKIVKQMALTVLNNHKHLAKRQRRPLINLKCERFQFLIHSINQ